jgi:threonyl-tRNA synthetase
MTKTASIRRTIFDRSRSARRSPFTPQTPEDLGRLEARMREIVAADYPMTGERVTREDALARFRDNPYKTEIAREIPEGEPITLYTIGDFTDLCRGGHAHSTGEIGALKLTSVAGAYWRGDEHNPMLQRIYGTAFPTQAELDAYLVILEEAARRDHRKLGQELGLFSIEEDAGGGLVFWHPKGAIVRGLIENFIREGLRERGYQPVVTPHVVTSGSTRSRGTSKTSGTRCSGRSKSRASAFGSSR